MTWKDPEERRAYHRAYQQRPEVKAKRAARKKAHRQRPEVKAHRRDDQRKYYQRNREEVLARQRTNQQRPEVKARAKAYGKVYRQRPEVKARRKEKSRSHHRKSKYDMTDNDYNRMWEEQEGLCPVCKEPLEDNPARGPACIDHDHDTDKVRGILHRNCNLMLGFANDDPTVLKGGIQYLLAH